MRLKYPPDIFFGCIGCGLCCRDAGRHRRKIFLTTIDARMISAATSLPMRDFCKVTHAAPKPFHYSIRKDSGTCRFLNEDSMCRIYDSRPVICRCYPFSVEFEDSSIEFRASSRDCPGLGRGKHLGKWFFEKLAKEVISSLRSCEEDS